MLLRRASETAQEPPPPFLDDRLWPLLGEELASRLDARSFFALRQTCEAINVETIGLNSPARSPHIAAQVEAAIAKRNKVRLTENG